MNFAVILIKSSTEEVPRLLEKFSRLRFRRVPADRWSDEDLRVLGLRDWTAIIDPQLVLPGEREACQAISGAMGTDVVVALLETVSGTYAFGLYRKGVVVREFSISGETVVRSRGRPFAGEPPLADMTAIDLMSLVEQVALPVSAIEVAGDVLHLRWDWVEEEDELDVAELNAHWPGHLHRTNLSVTNFGPGISTVTRVIGRAQHSEDRAWNALSGALGLTDAAVGERRAAPGSDVPAFAGIVEWTSDDPPHLLLRIDGPVPGYALVGVFTHDDQVHTIVNLRLFGDRAQEVSAREEPLWRAWMDARFPSNQSG